MGELAHERTAVAAIRRARPDEHEHLLALWWRSVRATHGFLAEEHLRAFRPLVGRYLATPGRELWVACDARDAPLGFLGLSGSNVDTLFLDPPCFRRGIGRRLMEHAAELRGELTVDVNEQNEGARRFYEALGFVVERRSPTDDMGLPYPLLHLRCKSPGGAARPALRLPRARHPLPRAGPRAMSGEREERLGAALAWGAASLRAAGWAPLSVFVLHLVVSRGFGAYVAWPGLDVPMHFVGGVAMAHFVFCALGGPAVGPVIGSLTRLGRGLGTFVSVGAAAAIWEFAEWTSDRMGISAAQVGLGDTLLDMLLGMTGAACYLGATWRLGRGAAGRRAQRAESAGVEHAP